MMKRVSDTQTSLLSLGFKRTRKGDDTSSSSDFTKPENADQHQDGNDECGDGTVPTQCFSECCNPCSVLDWFLKLFLTIPVTTASSKRTFSVMRRLKNFFRSSMTQERLNQALLLH